MGEEFIEVIKVVIGVLFKEINEWRKCVGTEVIDADDGYFKG